MEMTEKQEMEAAKREMALSAKACLLMARVRIMAEEVFPAHKPYDLKEAA